MTLVIRISNLISVLVNIYLFLNQFLVIVHMFFFGKVLSLLSKYDVLIFSFHGPPSAFQFKRRE